MVSLPGGIIMARARRKGLADLGREKGEICPMLGRRTPNMPYKDPERSRSYQQHLRDDPSHV